MAKIKHPKLVICPVKPTPPHPQGPKVGPSVEGAPVLTLLEKALDLSKDGLDLTAGSVVGSAGLGDVGETQQSNGLSFTAGSSGIKTIKFGATNNITVGGAEPGSQFFWKVNGTGQLEGHLNSVNGPLAIVLSIGGPTTAKAGHTAAPTLTATLTDAFPHADAGGANDIEVTGIHVVATDANNIKAIGDVVVHITDDVPTAVADTDSIPAATFGPATGNVITDAELDGGKDTPGADGVTVVGVDDGNTNANLDGAGVGVAVQGLYGKLTLGSDGSYSYVRDANTPGGVNDVFTYTIKDGDGDLAHTTLTISIVDAPPEITNLTPEAQGGDTSVDEDDLLALRGPGESAGSDMSERVDHARRRFHNQLAGWREESEDRWR